jgi:large subunit ribosomal protein L7/L12
VTGESKSDVSSKRPGWAGPWMAALISLVVGVVIGAIAVRSISGPVEPLGTATAAAGHQQSPGAGPTAQPSATALAIYDVYVFPIENGPLWDDVINRISEITAIRSEFTAEDFQDYPNIPAHITFGMTCAQAELIKDSLEELGARVLITSTKRAHGPEGPCAYVSATPSPDPTLQPQASVDVILVDAGPNRIAVIKRIREIVGLGLKEAKDVVDAAPAAIQEDIPRDQAEILEAELEQLGATVDIR